MSQVEDPQLDSNREEQLQFLHGLSPALAPADLETILDACGGNVEIAANCLLAGAADAEGPQLVPRSAKSRVAEPSPARRIGGGGPDSRGVGIDPSQLLNTTTLPIQEIMVDFANINTRRSDKALYESDQLPGSNGSATSNGTAQQQQKMKSLMESMETVSRLYSQAQQSAQEKMGARVKEQQTAQERRLQSPPPRNIATESAPMAVYDGVRDVELLPMEVDEEARSQLISEAIPFLMRRLEAIELPPQTDPGIEMELPLLGACHLALQGASLKVAFTEHSTADVVPGTDGVMISMSRLEASFQVKDISLSQKAGRFATRGKVHGHVFDIGIRLFATAGRTRERRHGIMSVARMLSLKAESVSLGRLILTVGKSCASWIYNMFLVVLKSRITAAIEQVIIANVEAAAEPISHNMEFVPLIVLAVMQAENQKCSSTVAPSYPCAEKSTPTDSSADDNNDTPLEVDSVIVVTCNQQDEVLVQSDDATNILLSSSLMANGVDCDDRGVA